MRDFRSDLQKTLPWLLAGVAGAWLAAWAFPLVFPFYPRSWEVAPSEAKAIALEHLRELAALEASAGDDADDGWPDEPWVVVDRITEGFQVEQRLHAAAEELPVEDLQASELASRVFQWRVTVYPEGSFPNEWSYRAQIAPDGRILALRHRIDPEVELPPLDAAAAVERADAFLRRRGFDLDRYARPDARSQQLRSRTDLALRYRSLEAALGERFPYGVEVQFAGDRLIGYDAFLDDPDEREGQARIQGIGIWNQLTFLATFLMVALVAVVFVRRYHAGEVGVRRGLQIFAGVLAAGTVLVFLISRSMTEGQNWGIFTRQQIPWIWGLQWLVIFFLPMALLAFLSWSVGESLCRERWGRKLAPFDALFQGEWDNATVARASLRGLGAGLGLLGLFLGVAASLRPLGVWTPVGLVLDDFALAGRFPGITLFATSLAAVVALELFGRLFLLPYVVRRLGVWLGAAVAVLVGGLLIFPPLAVLPLEWGLALGVLMAAAMVTLFLAFDLLTVLLASFVLKAGIGSLALVLSDSPALQVQGWLVLAVAAVPAALSVRHLGSGREFVYRWDDVPPHVRRIAERERQRVELETARRIQSSILPDLPPRLAGVEIAHAYLPASEVGGDFYDVLALEDGRLSVALGDVAGHGVSSGLVMAAAKSALAVQVTFDPEVRAVFGTLNRLVFQSARRRLIATLCYALIDPVEREILFASAGHLYPYIVGRDGRVRDLASIAYPLGVRPEIEVSMVRERLEEGDTVVLLSDGVVEARAEGSAELYGFERLEARLGSLAGESVEKIRDGVLADVERFSRHAPREDDQTLLVLRMP